MRRLASLVGLVTLTALAISVLWASPAGAMAPQRHTFSFHETYVDDTTCGFRITVHQLQTLTETDFFDRQGNIVRGRFHVVIFGTDTAKGVTLQDDSRHDSFIEDGTVTDTGLIFVVKLGTRVVTRGAGKIVFDVHFNVIFHAGHPFHGDFFAVPYCAAFG
jgi:hypothetical protein